MLIIWGTKRIERERGTIADFCPICREVRALRFVRDSVVPVLVRALAPLKPLREEVDHALDLCRKNRWKIGKTVPADLLWAKLEERPVS